MAMPKLATLNSACLASTIWVKIVALTVTTTLSRGDHLLAIARHRDLAHVDALQRVDERCDDDQARLVGLAVLAEPLDHADLALLHDVDHLAQHDEQDQDDEDGDDQRTNRDVLQGRSCQLPMFFGGSHRQGGADDVRDDHGCRRRYRRSVSGHRQPGLAEQANVATGIESYLVEGQASRRRSGRRALLE